MKRWLSQNNQVFTAVLKWKDDSARITSFFYCCAEMKRWLSQNNQVSCCICRLKYFWFAPDNRYFATFIVAFRSVFGQINSHFTAVFVCFVWFLLLSLFWVKMYVFLCHYILLLDLLLVKEPISPLHCVMFAVKSVSRWEWIYLCYLFCC